MTGVTIIARSQELLVPPTVIKTEHQSQSKSSSSEDKTKLLRNDKTPLRLYINCPYKEKEQVKALGAVWDAQVKCWYIPPYINDLTPFIQWIHDIPNPNTSKSELKTEVRNENSISSGVDRSVSSAGNAPPTKQESYR